MTYAEIVIFELLPKVSFYSIKYEGEEKSEANKFFERFARDENRQNQVKAFVKTLRKMGEITGASDFYFDRPEGFISALPSKKGTKLDDLSKDGVYDFDLRLFWYKLSPTVVVLFNGGIKSSEKLQDSPDLYPAKFRAAEKAAKLIYDALKIGGEFEIDDKTIVSKYNTPIEIYL